MKHEVVAGLAAVSLFMGCTQGRERAGEVAIDTLTNGTIVARNPATSDSADGPWELRSVARIGADSGSGIVFGRVHDVAIGPGERVYVLDGQASEVRVFTTAGEPVGRFGRQGRGPGDLDGAYALAFDGAGRLWVAEERNNRYSVFAADGKFIESHRRPVQYSFTPGVLRFSKGGDLYELSTQGKRGVFRISAADSVALRHTSPLPAPNRMAFRKDAGGEQSLAIVPFSPRQIATVGSAGDAWVSSGDAYRLAQLGPDGDTVRIIEKQGGPVALSTEERAKANADADRYAAEGYIVDRALIPQHHPALSAIVVADDGTVWVRRLSAAETRKAAYDVFDVHGIFVATVPSPMASSPAPHITGTYVAGVVLGANDEPYVEIFRIIRR
jgi:tripartite motif-containing protein 2/3/tripartite motif-containing protein 71